MKARYLKQNVLDTLRQSIVANLDRYRSGDFNFLEGDPDLSFEYGIEIDAEALAKLQAPSGTQYFEPENCANLHKALKNLSAYEACDERFWAYLSHTKLLEHGRVRWPIPKDNQDAEKHIGKHFFGRDKRQIERDNVGSRLWWMAHLCKRVEIVDHKEALEALLFRSDVRANLIERPTTSQTVALFGTVLSKLVQSYNGKRKLFERNTFRLFMREINSVGGYRLLDCLSPAIVEEIVDGIISEKLSLSQI